MKANGWQSSEEEYHQREAIDGRQLHQRVNSRKVHSLAEINLFTLKQVLSILVAIFQSQLDVQLGQQRLGFLFLVVHDGIEHL